MFTIETSSLTYMVFIKDPSGRIVGGINYAENDYITSSEQAVAAAKILTEHLNLSTPKK